MRLSQIALLLLLPTLACAIPSEHTLIGKALGWVNANTIVVLTDDGTKEHIRLWGMDAPETRGQPYRDASMGQLLELVALKTVTVTWDSRDRNGRILGWVIAEDGQWVNKVMVLNGYAWWNEEDAPDEDQLKEAQKEAQEAKRGMWDESGLYSQCDGHPFFATGCEDGSCADEGLSSRLYDIWKERFVTIHGLSDDDFYNRIEIRDIVLTDGPRYVFWKINYIFKLDWVRSRQNESVRLGKPTIPYSIDSARLLKLIDRAIEEAEQFDLPSVASISTVKAAFDTCVPDMSIDWCHLNFLNHSGTLIAKAYAELDRSANLCKRAQVDIGTGELMYCSDTPCWYDFDPLKEPNNPVQETPANAAAPDL